jgi:hypothetical protein
LLRSIFSEEGVILDDVQTRATTLVTDTASKPPAKSELWFFLTLGAMALVEVLVLAAWLAW